MISLIASMCLSPSMLLEALPNEIGGVLRPLVEHKAQRSYYLNGADVVVHRDAHVLSKTFRMGHPQGQPPSRIGIPIDSCLEFGGELGETFVKLNWGTTQNPIWVLTKEFSGSSTDIYVHLANASHDPIGDLANASVRIYTKYWFYNGASWQEVVASLNYTFEMHLAIEDAGIDTRKTYLNPSQQVNRNSILPAVSQILSNCG
ncbi:MAG: hypothetical protein ACR2HJ_01800 [Fimbriimonadales bacterium]